MLFKLFKLFFILGICYGDIIPQNAEYITNCAFASETGIQRIRLDSTSEPFEVYCDVQTPGGRWTLVMHRFDGSVSFHNRSITEFSMGFGNMHSGAEFFLGLDKLSALTNSRAHELVIHTKDLADRAGEARYLHFRVADKSNRYRIINMDAFNGGRANSMLNYEFMVYDKYARSPGWSKGMDANFNQDPKCGIFGEYPVGKGSNSTTPQQREKWMSWANQDCVKDQRMCMKMIKMFIRPTNVYYSGGGGGGGIGNMV